MNRKYTKEQLQTLATSCNCYRQVLLKLNLKETGGNYKNLKTRFFEFGVDISHWKSLEERMNWNKGMSRIKGDNVGGYKETEIFIKNSHVSTQVVKRYLESESTYIHKCQICGITEWQDNIITLDLDHINGDNQDNRRENLRFICPNCHSQTNSYKGKNINRIDKEKVTDDKLLNALKVSKSVRKALIVAGLTPKGGNYVRAYKLININNLSHLI